MNNLSNKYNKIVIFILGLTIIACLLFILFLYSTKGGVVQVYSDGRLITVLDLNENQNFEIKDSNGNITNILVIENGYAYIQFANCKDHTCMNMGKISHNNQSIVCLPNKLVVNIQNEDSNTYDSVVQ